MTRGRPITGNSAKSVRMEIRLEPGEATAYDELASNDGVTRSEWMRGVCNQEVRKAKAEGEQDRVAGDSDQLAQPKKPAKRKKSTGGKDDIG
jgi:hypothetical protein